MTHKGYKQTEDVRRKISEAAQKRAQDPEWRRKVSEANRKKAQDPEFRRKLSEVVRQAWQNDPERRRKMSETSRERWQDPEHRQKMSKPLSEEHRRKLSEANKGKKRRLCHILKTHAEELKDDPERLSTDFIKVLLGTEKTACEEVP